MKGHMTAWLHLLGSEVEQFSQNRAPKPSFLQLSLRIHEAPCVNSYRVSIALMRCCARRTTK